MRKVKVLSKKWVNGTFEPAEPFTAMFHQFGNAYEEFENGIGNYTVAIVENDAGEIIEVTTDCIIFEAKS